MTDAAAYNRHAMAQQRSDKKTTKSGNAKLKRLRNLARNAIAMVRNCDPEDIDDITGCGSLIMPVYSTLVLVLAAVNPTRILLKAKMLEGCVDEDLATSLLDEVNHGLEYGEMLYKEGEITYHFTLEIEDPTVDDLAPVIASFSETADLLGERLKARLGGNTALDRADDEVWL